MQVECPFDAFLPAQYIVWTGYPASIYEIIEEFPVKDKNSRRSRRKTAAKKAKRFKEIAKRGNYPSGYYLVNGRVKKGSRGDNSRFLKNQSNKKIRRKSTDYEMVSGKGGYRKEYDYWWELI